MTKFLRKTFESDEDRICYYAEEGEYDLVKGLIQKGVGVNCRYGKSSADEICPLLSASRFNQKDVVKLLLDNGADADMIVGGNPVYSRCFNTVDIPYKDRVEMLKMMVDSQPGVVTSILELMDHPYHAKDKEEAMRDSATASIIAEMREIKRSLTERSIEAKSDKHPTLRHRNLGSDKGEGRISSETNSSSGSGSDKDNPNDRIKTNSAQPVVVGNAMGPCSIM